MKPVTLYSLTIVSLLIACTPDKNTDTADTNIPDTGEIDTGTIDTGNTDTGDLDTAEDTGEEPDTADTGTEPPIPEEFWTEGPALPECTAQENESSSYALSGIVLMPNGPIAGHVVYDASTGLISCAGEDCDISQSNIVCTEGVISPGLIDGHNHMQYNALAPWQHEELFESRYDWQSSGSYYDYREAYDGIANQYKCEIGKWAELRTLVGGGTTVVGSSGGSCIAGIVRNLDEDPVAHGIFDYKLKYSSGRVGNYDDSDSEYFNGKLDDGELGAVMNHVAEGVKGSVSGEIEHMFDIGMAGPGQIFVHATDATTPQLARMLVEGTSILWSPRSNLDLYQATTQADIAMRLGIPVALGPDWTWSGSSNPSRELTCAMQYLNSRKSTVNDQKLWEMGTTDVARMVGLDGILGILHEGALADLVVYSYDNNPYRPIIEANPRNVKLAIVAGKSLYGTSDLISSTFVSVPEECEEINACDESRTFCVYDLENPDTYADLKLTLETALSQETMPEELAYAKELFGLFMCEETRPSCNIASPSAGDDDGDGVTDSEDNCLDVYNPLQSDYDSDGQGDACDLCVLSPQEEVCTPDPIDVEGDGFVNEEDNCPWLYNPNQLDSDEDGKGDECDPCPNTANIGDAGCPFTIDVLTDQNHPEYPGEGTFVILENLVVTANRRDSNDATKSKGFYAQDPTRSEYGAIFVYTGNGPIYSVGDEVRIEGEYVEYYDLAEITNATVQVTNPAVGAPAPIVISNPCDIATNGAQAEAMESMLVRVENISVSNSNPDDPGDYNEFEVGGCLRIDDMLVISPADTNSTSYWEDQPQVGTSYSAIQGILTYSYGHFKVLPRSQADSEGDLLE